MLIAFFITLFMECSECALLVSTERWRGKLTSYDMTEQIEENNQSCYWPALLLKMRVSAEVIKELRKEQSFLSTRK